MLFLLLGAVTAMDLPDYDNLLDMLKELVHDLDTEEVVGVKEARGGTWCQEDNGAGWFDDNDCIDCAPEPFQRCTNGGILTQEKLANGCTKATCTLPGYADVPTELGQTLILSEYDTWQMKLDGNYKSVLDWGVSSLPSEFPASCLLSPDVEGGSCSVHIVKDVATFSTSTDAADVWDNKFGLEGQVGGGAKEAGGTASANTNMAFNTGGSGKLSRVKSGSVSQITSHGGCTTINPTCLRSDIMSGAESKLKLSEAFLKNIESLGKNYLDPEGKNRDAMESWETRIIKQYGTHLIVGLNHGASFRQSITSEKNGMDHAYEASSKICVGMEGTLGPATAKASTSTKAKDAAAKTNEAASKDAAAKKSSSGRRRAVPPVPVNGDVNVCNEGSSSNSNIVKDTKYKEACTTVGGGGTPALKARLCAKDSEGKMLASEDEFAEFINAGLENSSENVIGMKVMELATIWFNVNTEMDNALNIKRTFHKAIEYHNCQIADSTEWDYSTGTCKCTRKCSNNGVVDPETCTCLCFGDDLHGYEGEHCETAYGSCQPGSNAGAPVNSGRCSELFDGQLGTCRGTHGNYNLRKEQCSPGETCCATWYTGTCCPFGYACGHRRWWKRPVDTEKWYNKNQKVYMGCSKGACDLCIPPNAIYRGATYNDMPLTDLFPRGTTVPSPLQKISHPSWSEMNIGKEMFYGRGIFRSQNRAGKQNRRREDGTPSPLDEAGPGPDDDFDIDLFENDDEYDDEINGETGARSALEERLEKLARALQEFREKESGLDNF